MEFHLEIEALWDRYATASTAQEKFLIEVELERLYNLIRESELSPV